MPQTISGSSPSTPNNPKNPTTYRKLKQLKPSKTATHIIRGLTAHTSCDQQIRDSILAIPENIQCDIFLD